MLVMNFNARFQMEKGYDGMRICGQRTWCIKRVG
jgi:hypothetical protein